eukprot:Phypoly_transcript_06499.p1 GENE.Phypoly_transcript_06499~~Phypoly_transcript_06499.p1  ORF type:complete len:524 (+),score=25.33 Phypoly_transcript_06499:208-1779(+)
MTTYIPLTGLNKRKESDPSGIILSDSSATVKDDSKDGAVLSKDRDHSLAGSGHISKEDHSDLVSSEGINAEGGTLFHLKSVGIFRLAAILFFMGYGGSYGVEGALSTGPPHYVLISFMIAPFIWALPEALVTAELSSALPNVGGNILWARKAFGKFLAWQSGFWALLSIPAAVGIFPVMFVSNLEMLLDPTIHLSTWAQAMVHFVMITFVCGSNILGLKSVGGGNILFSLLVLTPFFLFVTTGIAKEVWSWEILTSKKGDIQWQSMITFAIWSCGGWTNGGQIAGEIHNPRKSFNFAILIVMALTLTFSLLPLSVAACVYKDQLKEVKIGFWVTIAQKLGGPWLRIFMAFGAMFSALGEMNSSFCAQARLLHYLSSCEDFSFPRSFARLHSTYHTPYVAVLTLGVVSFVVALLPFQTIMGFVVFLASISVIISFACLIRLRIDLPDLERPFKVPFGKLGVIYTCGVGISIATFNLVIASRKAQITGICLIVAGIGLYYTANYCKRKFVARASEDYVHLNINAS